MNTRLPQWRLLFTAVLAGGLLTAGCAGTDPADPEASVNPTSSPTSPTDLPTTAPTDKAEVTVTGRVEIVELEGGCKVLRTSANKTFELKDGDPAILKAGAQVTVRGRIRSDIATICQMGPVLEVVSIQSS